MIVNITGELVLLGPLRRDLFPVYTRWHNDPEIGRQGSSNPQIRSLEAQTSWFERQMMSENSARFTIHDRVTKQPIGMTGLKDIDHRARSCESSILIGEKDFHGRRYGAERWDPRPGQHLPGPSRYKRPAD